MSEITIEALENTYALKHLPILTLDERWYHLVPDAVKTDEIRYWEKQVNQYLKKQGQLDNDIKEVKKIKSQLIKSVVLHMEDDDNDPKHKKLMSINQRLIQEAKDKISQMQGESEDIPNQLQMANQRLMIETVRMCYQTINQNNDDIEVLEKWIDATRIKLKKNLLIKQDKETVNEQTYSYMHDILGSTIMGELDRINDSENE